jgi:hypothetical protein
MSTTIPRAVPGLSNSDAITSTAAGNMSSALFVSETSKSDALQPHGSSQELPSSEIASSGEVVEPAARM